MEYVVVAIGAAAAAAMDHPRIDFGQNGSVPFFRVSAAVILPAIVKPVTLAIAPTY